MLQGEIACLESTALEEIEVESCLHRKRLTVNEWVTNWRERMERNIVVSSRCHHSPLGTSKEKLEGNWPMFCLASLVLDSSKVAISRGVFDWYFVRGPTGDVWFQKCCNHQRSVVAFGIFQKMEIKTLPTRIFQIDLKHLETNWSNKQSLFSSLESTLTQRVFLKHFRTAQIEKRTKWSRSFGIMAPCGGLWG